MRSRNRKMPYRPAFALAAFSLLLLVCSARVTAQNSPYSRYGLGDLRNAQQIANRAMGGVAQAYGDGQTINFRNPASYGALQLSTLDLGVEAGRKGLTDQDNNTYKATFGTLSYLQLGVPLKPGGGWGLVMGLAPRSDINYNIQRPDSLKGNVNEPLSYLYKGSGGSYQAFVGTGFRIKGFRFGVNAGYLFGSLERSTQAVYPLDSVSLFNSNTKQRTGFGGFFWQAGVQAHLKLGKKMGLELGASGSASQTLKARRDYLMETFYYSGDPANEAPQNQDTVKYSDNERGHIVYPQQMAFGLLLHDQGHWNVGLDYETGKWSDYRYYGAKDSLQDNWMLRLGIQYVPSTDPATRSYWSIVAYRVGFYTGTDYLRYGGQDLPVMALTFGAGLPIRNFTRNGQYTLINTAFEVGRRGNGASPLKENFFRFSLGLTLGDIWFNKRKYQ